MKFGEVLDYLHAYELREAKANHRARMIMVAMNGLTPEENWPIAAFDQQPEEEDFFAFMKSIT